MEGDFDFVCYKIDEDQEFFNSISQEIWRTPELGYNEVNAHECLSNALQKYGFHVQKHYHLDTAFKGEYESSKGSGPTIAILLEYDALPEIGHACGHNLIAEAGLAAAVSVKSIMEKDPSLGGKLVVMGTPAEESKGGKIKLIEKGAFNGIDVAMMTHPSRFSSALPPFLCNLRGRVQFMGKESHAAAFPWKGVNALDAAVICYNSLSCLRQQLKATHRIHINVAEGGIALNIIPAKSVLRIAIRTPTMGELNLLRKQVENCIRGAATSTNCEVTFSFDEAECYQSVISNKILANLYREYFEKLDLPIDDNNLDEIPVGSTDMGNVSHIIPSIHPFYAIPGTGNNHTKGFTVDAGSQDAQKPTLISAKAMAMTTLSIMRHPDIFEDVKKQFQVDLAEDLKNN